jgi:hypothetical protein
MRQRLTGVPGARYPILAPGDAFKAPGRANRNGPWQAVEKQPASAAKDGCDSEASAQAIDSL